jgi:cell division protein FtsN
MARRNRNSRRNDSAPGWVWMLFGLGLGLVVAVGVYLRGEGTRPPAARETAATPAPAPAAPTRETARNGNARPAAPAPAEENRFDFYEILPQYEVVVPQGQSRAAPAVQSKPVEEPGRYLLQAGSFSAPVDADRLQANLALLGIESHVQRVTIDDDVFHRVRIGPISDLESLNRTRRQLRDAGIDPLLMKAPN